MEINVNTEIKGFGLAVTAPAVDREDRVKPQVTPIAEGTGSDRAALGDKELHRREGGEKKPLSQVSAEELTRAVEEIQSRLEAMGSRLNFAVNREPEAVIVQVTDRQSGEVIKQFPSEEVLQLRKKLQELSGLLFDEKA